MCEWRSSLSVEDSFSSVTVNNFLNINGVITRRPRPHLQGKRVILVLGLSKLASRYFEQHMFIAFSFNTCERLHLVLALELHYCLI